MLNSGHMSDLTLEVGEEKKLIPVHKVILAARCDFFRTMFSGPFLESTSSTLSLPHTNSDALDIVLRFIYTGSVDVQSIVGDIDSLDVASNVLHLADLWGMTTLFNLIEDSLASILIKGNVDPLSLITFAKSHNCKRLVMQVSYFKIIIKLSYVTSSIHHIFLFKTLLIYCIQGLELARSFDPGWEFTESAMSADPDVISEIQDYIKSLL